MKSQNFAYRPAVDHLRAYAAVLILLYHGVHMISAHMWKRPAFDPAWIFVTTNPLITLVVEGHTAVALFMVLSGFIFTHGALDKTVRWGAFMRNRVLRIYPMFLVMSVVGMAAFPDAIDLMKLIQALLPLPLQMAYLGAFGCVTWAIGVEFQFYMVFPFLLARLQRDGLRWLLAVLGLCIAFRLLILVIAGQAHAASYLSIVGRMDQFLIGMAIAVAYRRLSGSSVWWWPGLAAVAVAIPAATWWYNMHGGYHGDHAWKVLWPTVEGLLWGSAILTYLKVVTGRLEQAMTPIARLGELSLSMYLLHVPFIQVAITISRYWALPVGGSVPMQAFVTCLVLVLPMTVLMSMATYTLIEKPFLAMRTRYVKPREAALPASDGQAAMTVERAPS